jgi:hypothetical protein
MRSDFRIKYLTIISALIAGYFLLLFVPSFHNQTFCLFRLVTGIPCPACGSTRATLLLFHGDFAGSFLLNPFGILTNIIILLSIAWMMRDIVRNDDTFLPFLKRDWDNRAKIVLTLIVTINWIWNIAKGV